MANAAPALLLPQHGFSRGQRFRALARFTARRLRQRLAARLALLYSVGLTVTYGVFVLLAASASSELGARSLLLRELRAASLIVAGLVALSLAANWDAADADEGIGGLLRQRGFRHEHLSLARLYAGARRIALLVGVPALVLCGLAGVRARSLSSGLELLGMAAAAAAFALVLGVSLSALALAARTLAPRFGRTLLLALVLVPHAARELWPGLPSVPAIIGWLLSLVGRAGGVA